MKSLAEIVSNAQKNSNDERLRLGLTRTLSCPSSLSKFSDESNSIVTINDNLRPQTAGRSSLNSKPKEKETVAKPILPAKRSCCEQSVEKENVSSVSSRPSKTTRFASSSDSEERSAEVAHVCVGTDSIDATDSPRNTPSPAPLVPTKQNHTAPVEVGHTDTGTNSKAKAPKRSQKQLSRSSTLDNSDIPPAVRQMKITKQKSVAIETWKLNTIKSRQRNIEQTKQAGLANNNLLSNFVQYEDQLQSSVQSANSQRKSLLKTNDSLLASRDDDDDDGVPMCLMGSETTKKERRRSTETRSTEMTEDIRSSSLTKKSYSSTESNFSKLSIVLRTFFVICSLLSFISRCLVWFGGKMDILYSLLENPMMWTLRLYVSTFHLALLIVELGWGIPIILPRGETLSILTQRGFVQSFLGIIDLLMHSNKRMAEHIDILQDVEGALMSARDRRVQISYAIISVSSRGMIVVGCIYFLCGLLYDEHNGKRKKHGSI